MKRGVLILVALVIVVGGYFGYERLTKPSVTAAAQLQTAQVQKGTLSVTVSGAGNVSAKTNMDLSFRISGQVKTVHVQLGDQVKAGQLLMELDTTDLEMSMASAEISLRSAQANYDKVKAGPSAETIALAKLDLKAAADALQKAQADYDRVSWRPDIGMLPQSSALQQATQNYEKAKITYAQNVKGPTAEDLTSAQAQIDQAKITLQQAQEKVEQAKLVAPIDGTIAAINFDEGEYAGANAAAITVVDLSALQLKVLLAETDVARVAAGQAVSITLDALTGVSLPGKVSYVAPVATVSQGVVNYPVTVDIEKTNPAVRIGMTAAATIVVQRKDNVLLVPNRAIYTSGRQRTVQVLSQGQTTQVPVTLGVSNETMTEVVSGLKEGDVVVLRSTTTTSSQQTGRGIGLGGLLGGR